VLVSCAILAGGLAFSAAQALAAAGEPAIVSESATSITEHGATLEAEIDPNGLETSYEFWVESADCQPGPCESISVGPVGHGYIAAGSAYPTVRVELSDLQPGYSYTYWVFAVNSAGWAKGMGKEFKAVNPGGGATGGAPIPRLENTATPFERPVESWIGKASAEGAARELAKAEEERKAREAEQSPPPVIPVPKGVWCGEAGVTCEGSEAALGGVSLTGTALEVQGAGMALVKLDCRESAGCSGKLRLTARTAVKTKGRKGKRQNKGAETATIGTASFSIAGDETKTVRVELNAAGRASLKADHGHLSARLAILKLAPSPANNQINTVRLVQQKTHDKTRKGFTT
jgi:hypothetical protein